MNLFAYIGYVGGITTTIVGVIKFIEFRNDRKGKLVAKLEFYDEYGLFGSTKKPYFILTITNIGKSIRQIFPPTINFQFGKMMYEPTTRIIEYPHKMESGDQLVIEFDFDLIGV